MFSFVLNFFLRDLRKTIFEFCGDIDEKRILDIGCGDGHQLFYFKKKEKKTFLFGVDINEKSIEKAKKKSKKYSKNVNFLSADAKKLPFEDNFFDFVLISLVLHENRKDDSVLILNEALRVLKNRGYLILADFNFSLFKNFIGKLIWLIEFLIGKENYKNFRGYLKFGGLDYYLKKTKNITKEKEKFLMKKNIRVIKLKKYEKSKQG